MEVCVIVKFIYRMNSTDVISDLTDEEESNCKFFKCKDIRILIPCINTNW